VSRPPDAPVRPVEGQLPSASDRWGGWAEVRADLRRAGLFASAVVVAGIPAGLLWWALAPRAEFRITQDGPAAIGSPSSELFVADDGVFVLVMAGLGLLAGLVAWAMRRSRGIAQLVAVALGSGLAGAVAWGIGALLGGGPSKAELAEVGTVVTTRLGLGSTAALAVAPFVAVLVYVLGGILTADDGLGRTTRRPTPDGPPAPSRGSA
jgi:hypothetical protein